MEKAHVVEVATPADIPALLDLLQEQYDYHIALDPEYYAGFTPALRGRLEEHLQTLVATNDHLFVVRKSGSILGFAMLHIRDDAGYDSGIKRYGEIVELYVVDAFRRRGVGTALTGAVEAHLREQQVTFIKVQCAEGNVTARSFYAHIGYEPRQLLLYKPIGDVGRPLS